MPTIEIPTPSAEMLAQLEAVAIEDSENTAAAIAAIRESFAPYAKHNGFIRTADYDLQTSNYRVDREAFYTLEGRKVKGLLACDDFLYRHTDQNRGIHHGSRLYLTESGEWLQLVRVGRWSICQGEAQWWYTTLESAERIQLDDRHFCGEDETRTVAGTIKVLTDAEVAAQYKLSGILAQLEETMTELSKKIPERYARLKANAELAARTVAALKQGK